MLKWEDNGENWLKVGLDDGDKVFCTIQKKYKFNWLKFLGSYIYVVESKVSKGKYGYSWEEAKGIANKQYCEYKMKQ